MRKQPPEDCRFAHLGVKREQGSGDEGVWILCTGLPGPGWESVPVGPSHSFPALDRKQLFDRNIM